MRGRDLVEWERHEPGIRKPGTNPSLVVYCRLTLLSFSSLWTYEIMHVRSLACNHGSYIYLTIFSFGGGSIGKGVCEQPEAGHPAWSTGLCALPSETLSRDTRLIPENSVWPQQQCG